MILTVVFVDTYECECNVVHLGEATGFKRRTVQLELTDEQARLLTPRKIGGRYDSKAGVMNDVFEDIDKCWIEPESKP